MTGAYTGHRGSREGQGGCPEGGGWGVKGGTEDVPKELTLEQGLEGRLGLK